MVLWIPTALDHIELWTPNIRIRPSSFADVAASGAAKAADAEPKADSAAETADGSESAPKDELPPETIEEPNGEGDNEDAARLAKNINDVLNKVDGQVYGSRAMLGDMTFSVDSSLVRVQEKLLAKILGQVLAPGAEATEKFNSALRNVYRDRRDLRDNLNNWVGACRPIPGKRPPVSCSMAKRVGSLSRLAADAEEAQERLDEALAPAQAALRLMSTVRAKPSQLRPRADDIQDRPQVSEGETKEEAASTSSGCVCDEKSICATRGQPFAWCRLASHCPQKLPDPLGLRHDLPEKPPKNGSAGTWDYCIPPRAQRFDTKRQKTVHYNCHCAPRYDVVKRYMHDTVAFDGANFNLALVPLADRLTLEAMTLSGDGDFNEPSRLFQTGDSLCRKTASSGPFSVCPVAEECTSAGSASSTGVVGVTGAGPSAWFTGVAKRSWDFCVDPLNNMEEGTDGSTAPGEATAPFTKRTAATEPSQPAAASIGPLELGLACALGGICGRRPCSLAARQTRGRHKAFLAAATC